MQDGCNNVSTLPSELLLWYIRGAQCNNLTQTCEHLYLKHSTPTTLFLFFSKVEINDEKNICICRTFRKKMAKQKSFYKFITFQVPYSNCQNNKLRYLSTLLTYLLLTGGLILRFSNNLSFSVYHFW